MILVPRVLVERAKPARLALDNITLDERLQLRKLRLSVVKDYLGVLRRGEELPPVLVIRDGETYYLVDGFHRVAATRQQLGIEDIAVAIVDGTFADALWLSWGANRNHGLRRTQKDTRRAIQAAIEHPRWSRESDRVIAQHIGCDHKTVGRMRRECRSGEFPTENIQRSFPPSGVSKSEILRACGVLARLPAEPAHQFSVQELPALKAGYETLHRLLFGGDTLSSAKLHDREKASETAVNVATKTLNQEVVALERMGRILYPVHSLDEFISTLPSGGKNNG